MASTKNLLPSRRRLAVMLGFFFLMAILFSLFQFYYIPSNRDKLHQYGFMLLNRVKMNISDRDNDLRKFYSNKVETQLEKSVKEIKADLESKKFTDRFVPRVPMLSCLRTNVLDGSAMDSCDGFGFIKAQDEWLRIYTFHNTKQDSFGLGLPIRTFLEPAFSYRKELFESYLVINNCDSRGIVLYHDEKIGVGENVQKDSVLLETLSHSISQIVDIKIKGVRYKMFTYPFQLGSQSLVLCGTVKDSRYTNSLRSIPAGLIYPILILILVALVALPFVKPYLLSPHEKLNISDIYFMGIALFAGLTLITLLVIQALILAANEKREENYLSDLSGQLSSAFLKEINEASEQLQFFDEELLKMSENPTGYQLPHSPIYLLGKHREPSAGDGNPFLLAISDSSSHPSPYYFLERVFWIDGKGDQNIKAQLDTFSYQLINVSERSYYKFLKENRAYLFPTGDRRPFVFDPIYSWTAGGFKINISRESIQSPEIAKYAVLGSRFSSLVNTIFPTGYGYCLIDQDGNVLTHSNGDRNLRENFLQETGYQRILVETINSRQSNYMNRVMMYGKPYAMHISPVEGLPFHLVVFHDKTYRIPINLRILAFALVFILMFYVIAFVTLFVFRNVFGFRLPFSVFRPAIAYRDWVLPSSQRNRFYVSAVGFFIYYIFLFLSFCIFLEKFRTDNFVTLIITLFTPVNLIISLFLLERLLRIDHSRKNNKIFFMGWALFFLIVIVGMVSIPFDNISQRWQFFWFEISWLALPIVLWYLQYRKLFDVLPRKYENIPKQAFLSGFSWFTMILISCFTILPASVFTWFAHNYEIRQSVKKQQLAMGNSIVGRRDDLRSYFRNHEVVYLPDSFFYKVQYVDGVYKIQADQFYEVSDVLPNEDKIANYLKMHFFANSKRRDKSFIKNDSLLNCLDQTEHFYLTLADNLVRNYYDPSNLPALSSKSSDSSWYWYSSDKYMYFYMKYPYRSAWPSNSPLVKGLIVQSEIPERFVLLSKWQYRLAIILFTCGLIWLLVRLIKLTAARVLLPDHILSPLRSCKVSRKETSQDWASDARKNQVNPAAGNLFMQAEETEHKISNKPWDPLLTQYYRLKYDSILSDEELLDLVEHNETVFDRVWNKLSDKQKLLLLDMAQDGLINYRNTDEIRDLCGKGILIISEDRMQLFSYAFGYYLRTRKMSAKKELGEKFDQTGTWSSFRTPLIVIILSFAVFIFATQQDVWNKMIGLIGSLTAILTLLQRFIFTKSGSKE